VEKVDKSVKEISEETSSVAETTESVEEIHNAVTMAAIRDIRNSQVFFM
jgi:hypothetical protein